MVRYRRWRAAPFPLTPTLSLREREQRASRSGKPTGLDCSPRREGFTLSPRERAGVRGKRPPHGAARCLRLVVRPMPAVLFGFEPFTISRLRLCRRSLIFQLAFGRMSRIRLRQKFVFVFHHRIHQLADAADLELAHIAGLEKDLRPAKVPNACRCAGGDHIPRLQEHPMSVASSTS